MMRIFSPQPRAHPRSPSPSTLPLSSTRRSLTRSPSLLQKTLERPVAAFFGAIFFVFVLALLFGVAGEGERERGIGARRVVARDWEETASDDGAVGETLSRLKHGETVLILTPMKNSLEHIWHYFHLLDTLSYPRENLQIDVLVSDSTDRTYLRALELADERQYSHNSKRVGEQKGKRYGRITVLKKDFASSYPRQDGDEEDLSNVGAGRHSFPLQIHRRKLLAMSRTYLLTSTLTPEVDWVLWLDVDVVEYAKDVVETLIKASKGAEDTREAEVVVPNCMWKTYNEMGSYDRNNWAETPKSLEMKKGLSDEDVLIEGYEQHLITHRLNMADLYPATSETPDQMTLDGVGGCTTLVHADVHRKGAVFPSWVVDHQLETEGFAQLAKKVGARLRGLPKYYVYHGLYG